MFKTWATMLGVIGCALTACQTGKTDEPINPVPRSVLTSTLVRWDFADGDHSWVAENQCTVATRFGRLVIAPEVHHRVGDPPVDLRGGQVAVRLRLRSQSGGRGGVFWTTDQQPTRGEDKQVHFPLVHDGQWQEYVARFAAPGIPWKRYRKH